MGVHSMIDYPYSQESAITLKAPPFNIVLQGHAGKIRMLDVAIVRQKLTEMELNGIQYYSCWPVGPEAAFMLHAYCFSMEENHKIYSTIWL